MEEAASVDAPGRDARGVPAKSRVLVPLLPPAGLQIRSRASKYKWQDVRLLITCHALTRLGANMGEVIRFIPKSERERAHLIQEARAMYDSIFPPADPVSGQRDKVPASHAGSGVHAHRRDGV